MTAKFEPVGVAEVAKLAGVTRQHVYNWLRRSQDMPKPVRLRCGPVWNRAEIEEWLVSIGYTHLRKPKR